MVSCLADTGQRWRGQRAALWIPFLLKPAPISRQQLHERVMPRGSDPALRTETPAGLREMRAAGTYRSAAEVGRCRGARATLSQVA
jgi:hypothetical protein